MLADSAYGSGETRADLRKGKHIQAIKPIPLRRPAVADGFTRDDFTVDHQARTVTSPKVTPSTSLRKVPPRSGWSSLMTFEQALAYEEQAQAILLGSQDLVEGTTAIFEKRSPRFAGR